jgi:hypothetical protein
MTSSLEDTSRLKNGGLNALAATPYGETEGHPRECSSDETLSVADAAQTSYSLSVNLSQLFCKEKWKMVELIVFHSGNPG